MWCWEMNLNPLREQQVLLTTEPSGQLCKAGLNVNSGVGSKLYSMQVWKHVCFFCMENSQSWVHYACNPSMQEIEEGGVWLKGYLGLHSKTLSQNLSPSKKKKIHASLWNLRRSITKSRYLFLQYFRTSRNQASAVPLSHFPKPFVFSLCFKTVLLSCTGWPWTCNPSASALSVTRIIKLGS